MAGVKINVDNRLTPTMQYTTQMLMAQCIAMLTVSLKSSQSRKKQNKGYGSTQRFGEGKGSE